MKQIFVIFSLAFLIASCSKDEQAVPADNTTSAEKALPPLDITLPVPSTYTQKVMLELYSSSYCATCPDALRMYQNYANQYPDRVYGASVHDIDPMKISLWNTLDSMINITQYSSGSFNRLAYNGAPMIHKTQWSASNMMSTALNKTASCGLKISSQLSGTTLSVNVEAGFAATLTGQYRMTVYLIEDSVTGTASGYNQANYYNNIASSQWYQLGNPIIGYKHNAVVRKVLTSNRGNSVSINNQVLAGSRRTAAFTTSITGMNPANMFILAFIHKYGTTPTTQDVLNVQRARLGVLKNWD